MKRRASALAALLCLLSVCVTGAAGGRPTAPVPRLAQEAYVWQRVWTPAVRDAMDRSPPELSNWHILIAEADPPAGWRAFHPDIAELRSTPRPLTAVIRINGQRSLNDAPLLIARIAQALTARQPVVWSAVEIDYDCPTRALGQYALFLQRLRQALAPNLPLTVTVLPTWMGSDQLKLLLRMVDRSVLQVHSVMDPHHGLFDVRVAAAWILRYSNLTHRRFDVALPDYGSRVSWDPAGHLIAIRSEETDLTPDPVGSELQADPLAVAQLLGTLQNDPPAHLHGIVWFRLPVQGDLRIWSPSTWQHVMAGQPLHVRLESRLEKDAEGAWQLRIVNTGTVDAVLPELIRVPVSCWAADGEGLYGVEHAARETRWRLTERRWLAVGQTSRVGWIRCPISPELVHIES